MTEAPNFNVTHFVRDLDSEKLTFKFGEMFQKKDYIYGVSLVYLFLIMLFYTFEDGDRFNVSMCHGNELCVRFCCSDADADCHESFLKGNFKPHLDPYISQPDSLIQFGPPRCSLRKATNDSGAVKWSFTRVRTINNVIKIEILL